MSTQLYEDVPAKPPPVVATEPGYYGGHGEVYLYSSILIYVAYTLGWAEFF